MNHSFDFTVNVGPPEPEWFEFQEMKAGKPIIARIPNFGRLPTHVSVKNGRWNDPTVWNCGKVPVPSRHKLLMPVVHVNHEIVYDADDRIGEMEVWSQNPDGTWREGL